MFFDTLNTSTENTVVSIIIFLFGALLLYVALKKIKFMPRHITEPEPTISEENNIIKEETPKQVAITPEDYYSITNTEPDTPENCDSHINLSNNSIISSEDDDFDVSKYEQYTTPYRILGMFIELNVSSMPKSFYDLNENEKEFFYALCKQLVLNNLSPFNIKLQRLADGTFNVTYSGTYVGKINLYIPPPKYAVIKDGNKRATRIFSSYHEASNFISLVENYTIEERIIKKSSFMQYSTTLYNAQSIYERSLDIYILYIAYWIRYIKKS